MSSHGSNFSDQDSGSDSQDSHATKLKRPNRWNGPKSTWRGLTRDERGLAASLDTLRDQDLSVHLFNSHSLKRRAREYEDSERSRVEIPKLQDTRGFLPPKVWTAWPLPPQDVPRSGDEIGEEDELELFTLRMREKSWPSRELEEVLAAVTMKQAKERFQKREAVGAQGPENEDIDAFLSASEQKETDYDSEESRDPSPNTGQDAENRGSKSLSLTDPDNKHLAKKPVRSHLEPVITPDDDYSSQLLRPSIRHTLSKLDDVLMALHHARNTCHQYSKSDAGTDDEGRAVSVASFASEDLLMGKRPVGRPRKLQPIRNEVIDAENASPSPSQLLRSKKSNRGRPQKDYLRLENETNQEYLVRVARIQKKPLPSFALPLEPRPSPSVSPSRQRRSTPAHRATEEELFISRNKKLGLRDWSEVLGAAALAGFDQSVIERATQRCATLFGERMTLRKFVEAPFAEPRDFMTTYQPDMIPKMDEEASEDDSDDEDSNSEQGDSEGPQQTQDHKRKAQSEQPRFCRVSGCPRRFKAFRDHYSLKRHLQGVHKLTGPSLSIAAKPRAETITEAVEDDNIPSDEDMAGTVHVDGFLKPLKLTQTQTKFDQKGEKMNFDNDSHRNDHDRGHSAERDPEESRRAESSDDNEDSKNSSSPSSDD